MKHEKSVQQGFTLFEILIAISIIGILAAIFYPAVRRQLDSAKRSSTQSELNLISNAIVQYNMDIGEYPESLRDLIKRPADEKKGQKWNGPYHKGKGDKEILDQWSRPYKYKLNEEGAEKPFDVWSYGPNGPKAQKNEWIMPKE